MSIDLRISKMLEEYKESSLHIKTKLREVLQQCALLGLQRRGFFDKAAFYGGTALRILYGLDRFSEDLDFSLIKPDPNYTLGPYLDGLSEELESMGFTVEVHQKEKKKNSPIQSAFVKTNTHQLTLMMTQIPPKGIHFDEKLKIKFEIDTDPPFICSLEEKLIRNPIPFYISAFSLSDLFAGKLHALLCRGWGENVKGRDWYDFQWFVQKGTRVNLPHLEARMRQSGHYTNPSPLTKSHLKALIEERIQNIDWKMALRDITPFIHNQEVVALWSEKFFLDFLEGIDL